MNRTLVFSIAAIMLLGFASFVSAETIDGSIFAEEFTEEFLNPYTTQWAEIAKTNGTATITDEKLTLKTTAKENVIIYGTKSALDFTSSPEDWWLETSFNLVAATEEDGKGTSSYRQWVLLSGSSTTTTPFAPLTYVSGFDLRAITGDTGTTYQLGWYGWDNTASVGSDRIPSVIGTNVNLTKGIFYKVKLHRMSDGKMDIFLNDAPVPIDSTKTLIGANPNILWMGDYAGKGGVTGTVIYDYVRIGQPVPEPSTLALLACGMFGLLAYAWRKRK